jgi:hypothetical protein
MSVETVATSESIIAEYNGDNGSVLTIPIANIPVADEKLRSVYANQKEYLTRISQQKTKDVMRRCRSFRGHYDSGGHVHGSVRVSAGITF